MIKEMDLEDKVCALEFLRALKSLLEECRVSYCSLFFILFDGSGYYNA